MILISVLYQNASTSRILEPNPKVFQKIQVIKQCYLTKNTLINSYSLTDIEKWLFEELFEGPFQQFHLKKKLEGYLNGYLQRIFATVFAFPKSNL